MNFPRATAKRLLIFAFALMAVAIAKENAVTVKGYVLDSACAFTKNLDKPISAQCARTCARAGSPLVILSDDGTIYWPIAGTTPSAGQNKKLMPFAGQKVVAKGTAFERGGSKALVIQNIEAAPKGK
jgi:hypothetical protein